ncbi:MAG: hypothetical protein K0S48_1226 [Ramlibacter sp.]|nr:hypothetical protein [Ramlibacter sp.]
MACVASPRTARPAPDTIGDTAAMAGWASSKGTSACQLATERSRCARGWVSVTEPRLAGRSIAGATTSSGASMLTWAWAPSVLASVLPCRPVMSAEM